MPERVQQQIGIDCAPGPIRPDAYIAEVMEGSGVDYDGRRPISAFFGAWTWDFSDIPADTWEKARPVFDARQKQLFLDGKIRGGLC